MAGGTGIVRGTEIKQVCPNFSSPVIFALLDRV